MITLPLSESVTLKSPHADLALCSWCFGAGHSPAARVILTSVFNQCRCLDGQCECRTKRARG